MSLTAEDEIRKYDEWTSEWLKKKGLAMVIDFEFNFPLVFCSKCKFGEGEYLPRCTKVDYKTINGLLLQVLDEPYGKCKYYEPKE